MFIHFLNLGWTLRWWWFYRAGMWWHMVCILYFFLCQFNIESHCKIALIVKCITLVLSKNEFTCILIISMKLVLVCLTSTENESKVMVMEVYIDMAIILSSYVVKIFAFLFSFYKGSICIIMKEINCSWLNV